MSKILKIILGLILILATLFIANILYSDYKSTKIEGVVYDCETNQLIPDANLRIPKQMTFVDAITFQWGGGKTYSAKTDQTGEFSIDYEGEYFNAHVTKEGYLDASEYGQVGEVRIGLLKRHTTDIPSEYSRVCKRSSECILETKDANGNTVVSDTCGPLP